MTFIFLKCYHVHQEELLLQKLQCFQYPIFSHQQLFCAENNSANPAPKKTDLQHQRQKSFFMSCQCFI